MLDRFFKDIGIDLGTANSLVYLRNKGILIDEPTVVAINNKTNQILAVGDEAKKMIGRTPSHISVIRPLIGGVISDFDMTQELIRQFLKRLSSRSLFSFRRAILAIPDNLTEVERKSVEDAVLNSGCAKVYLIESPIAAALGANLPIHLPAASLIVDIGGGTTDIAVISMGGIEVSRTLKIAGDRFNEDIQNFIQEEFKLAVGESTAEFAKIAVGSVLPSHEKLEIIVRGRDFRSGLPGEALVKDSHVRLAISRSVGAIIDAIKEVIEETPPELVGDMIKQGIYLCGGGSMLRGLSQLVAKETAVETKIVENPLGCVARGLGQIIDGFQHNKKFLDNPLKPITINL